MLLMSSPCRASLWDVLVRGHDAGNVHVCQCVLLISYWTEVSLPPFLRRVISIQTCVLLPEVKMTDLSIFTHAILPNLPLTSLFSSALSSPLSKIIVPEKRKKNKNRLGSFVARKTKQAWRFTSEHVIPKTDTECRFAMARSVEEKRLACTPEPQCRWKWKVIICT